MSTLDLAGHVAWRTWLRPVASLVTRMNAGRLIPATNLETLAVVHNDFFRSMHCTIPAWSLAGMAAGQICVARRIATISGFCEIHMALNSHLVATSRRLLLDWLRAPNERHILGLPARQMLRDMATKQSPTSLMDMDIAFYWTQIAAAVRT